MCASPAVVLIGAVPASGGIVAASTWSRTTVLARVAAEAQQHRANVAIRDF
jgi:hypothetical protein